MKQLLSHSAVDAVRKLNGMAHTQQILAEGVHPRSLYAARDTGALTEISRGVFRLSELPVTEPDMLAVATRIPKALRSLKEHMLPVYTIHLWKFILFLISK